MDDILVLLINLDRSPARLERSSAALAAADVRFERLPAADGAELDLGAIPNFDAGLARRKMGRPLSAGEVGCYLSHLAAIDRFLASDASQCLVLEDDFDPRPGAFDVVAALPRALHGSGWDVVQLGRPAAKLYRRYPSDLPVELRRAYYLPITTTALLWSRAGAERFRAACGEIRLPVDLALQQHICRNGVGYACSPPPLPPRATQSEIAARGRDGHGGSAFIAQSRKAMFKWANNLVAIRRKWREVAR